MGRRSTHTPEQLRELIIRSAHDIIAENGLGGMSAREIARRIGYSPGTLYNLFDSLDDLVLQVEALLLDSLDQRLSELPNENSSDTQLNRIARTYLSFGRDHPNLWNLISQHEIRPDMPTPSWYTERLERLVSRIEEALALQLPTGRDNPDSLKRSARVLWAGLHGLTSLSTTKKLSSLAGNSADALVDELVNTYLAGLQKRGTGRQP